METAILESIYVQASRLGALVRGEGQFAFYEGKGLEFCPFTQHDEFYLAGLWRIGWLESERDDAVEWLANLTRPT